MYVVKARSNSAITPHLKSHPYGWLFCVQYVLFFCELTQRFPLLIELRQLFIDRFAH